VHYEHTGAIGSSVADIVQVMVEPRSGLAVVPVQVRDPEVVALVSALTADLGEGGYAENETFGYSVEQLEQAEVHLVGARVADRLVGLAGIELQEHGIGELKRFYVEPAHRGAGVADALIGALVDHAAARDTYVLRLETGNKQKAAISFYRRHGFAEVPRFEPYLDSETSVCMQCDLASVPTCP
jgi:putative acetyltransferase